jgi:uncharacterized repeat protein (TIGR03803 family)
MASLILDNQGFLYGTTTQGGKTIGGFTYGTVFKLAPDGTETVLHAFCSQKNCRDGNYPLAGLIADSQGNVYGTTADGGQYGNGTIFEIAPDNTETVLHSFDSTDGGQPAASLLMDGQGNFFGTTANGGQIGEGTVFKMAPGGAVTVLYSFCANRNCRDGADPLGGLIADGQGNLYGTTVNGGKQGSPCTGYHYTCGTIFKLAAAGGQTTLYTFCPHKSCKDGANPVGRLVADSQGNLYGAAPSGGKSACGVIYKLAPSGVETVLHDFCSKRNNADGRNPNGDLIADDQGNLYGTTAYGGAYGGGTVFKLATDGALKTLYAFCPLGDSCVDGYAPSAGLAADQQGNLYGTTSSGGQFNSGTVFKLRE